MATTTYAKIQCLINSLIQYEQYLLQTTLPYDADVCVRSQSDSRKEDVCFIIHLLRFYSITAAAAGR